MKIEVQPITIDGETVSFAWDQSGPNPFQSRNGFSIRYEGIDLTTFSTSLFHEIFLAIQLGVFAGYDEPVDVVLPEPVSPASVAFWTTYHKATRVTVTPLTAEVGFSPWADGPRIVDTPRTAGVFFGGGKDSMLTTCLLREIVGADSVLLLQCVHPFRSGQAELKRLTDRQERLMLRPARVRLGVATQRVWTDYLVHLQTDGPGRRLRPHLELYSAGFLPALLHWGVTVCTPGLSRTAYYIREHGNGVRSFRYRKSRPESLAAQSAHYRDVLGTDLTVTSVNYIFSPLLDFRLLAERYREALDHVVMCVSTPGNERWCYDCKKCAEFALFSLRCGIVAPFFDYERFFRSSRYVAKIVSYAESGVELDQSAFGNAPWKPFLGALTHYFSFCQAVFQIDPAIVADRLSPPAFANLLLIKALFGNQSFPALEMISTKGIDAMGNDLAREVGRIAAEHFTCVDDLPEPFLSGRPDLHYDFGVRMPIEKGFGQ